LKNAYSAIKKKVDEYEKQIPSSGSTTTTGKRNKNSNKEK